MKQKIQDLIDQVNQKQTDLKVLNAKIVTDEEMKGRMIDGLTAKLDASR